MHYVEEHFKFQEYGYVTEFNEHRLETVDFPHEIHYNFNLRDYQDALFASHFHIYYNIELVEWSVSYPSVMKLRHLYYWSNPKPYYHKLFYYSD